MNNKIIQKNRLSVLRVLGLGILVFGISVVLQGMKTPQQPPVPPLEQCASSDNPKNCYAARIKTYVDQGNIEDAFGALATLYDAGGLSGDTCHDLTHEIGQGAYQLFSRGKKFTVSPKTAYCSYGFYHGFMELLVSRGGSMQKAREFCAFVDSELAKQTPDVALQCYHGIGHGTVNSHDRRTWGDEQALITPALSLCEQVSDTKERLSRCATGVFNGIAVFYANGEYKLKPNLTDPLWICRAQEEKYKDACYISLNITLLSLAQGDIKKAAVFVEAIPEDSYAKHAMINLAAPVGTQRARESDFSIDIATCRSLSSRLHIPCLQGFAFGLMEHGTPEQEYVKAFEFCNNNILDSSEKTSCFEYIFSYLRQWYAKEKTEAICASVQSNYRSFCYEQIHRPMER